MVIWFVRNYAKTIPCERVLSASGERSDGPTWPAPKPHRLNTGSHASGYAIKGAREVVTAPSTSRVASAALAALLKRSVESAPEHRAPAILLGEGALPIEHYRL
jgi:hypothetical protein